MVVTRPATFVDRGIMRYPGAVGGIAAKRRDRDALRRRHRARASSPKCSPNEPPAIEEVEIH